VPAYLEALESGVAQITVKWPIVVVAALISQGGMLAIMSLAAAQGMDIFARSEAEQRRRFEEIMPPERVIARRFRESDSREGEKKGGNNNSRLFLAPLLMKLGAPEQ
jgi:hypothetical protein